MQISVMIGVVNEQDDGVNKVPVKVMLIEDVDQCGKSAEVEVWFDKEEIMKSPFRVIRDRAIERAVTFLADVSADLALRRK